VGKLQTGRFERLAARTYSIKGPGALVDLDETVLGVILLERQGGMESHLIQDWRTYGTNLPEGAVVGQYAWVAIHNPAGSKQIVVLDRFARELSGAFRFYRSAGVPPGFSLVAQGEGLDTRIGTATLPAAQTFTRSTNISSFGTQVGSYSTNQVIEWPVVIAEDGTFLWRSGSVNETLILSVYWAEREAAPFEIS